MIEAKIYIDEYGWVFVDLYENNKKKDVECFPNYIKNDGSIYKSLKTLELLDKAKHLLSCLFLNKVAIECDYEPLKLNKEVLL